MAYIDYHVLQTVPPSCINRDDTGAPKSATYGGVRRARVSSQAWKRAARVYFNNSLDASEVGHRTRRVVEIVARVVMNKAEGIEETQAQELVAKAFKTVKIDTEQPKKTARSKKVSPDDEVQAIAQSSYLLFLSTRQLERLADVVVGAFTAGTSPAKQDVKAAINAEQSFDLALFGRMVADDAALNVDAAVQVAHALGVGPLVDEFDYFTAVDDLQEAEKQSGAGMIGSQGFNSSTLYRYACINVDQLSSNLGDGVASARAVRAFTEAFVKSMPEGKQNSFANRTLPESVYIAIRGDQPINLSSAFEEPVRAKGGGIAAEAAHRLGRKASDFSTAYGRPDYAWVSGIPTATVALGEIAAVQPFQDVLDHLERTVVNMAATQ